MTRKRYIKLLMALGVSRNDADGKALLCRLFGVPYATDYARRAPRLRMAKTARNISVSLRANFAKFRSNTAVTAAAINRLAKAMGGGGHD